MALEVVYLRTQGPPTRSAPRYMTAAELGSGIIADEQVIVLGGDNTTLQSANFVTSVDGWRIMGSGDAEFNDVIIRGDVISSNYDPAVAGFFLDSSAGSGEFNGSITLGINGTISSSVVGSVLFSHVKTNNLYTLSGTTITLKHTDAASANGSIVMDAAGTYLTLNGPASGGDITFDASLGGRTRIRSNGTTMITATLSPVMTTINGPLTTSGIINTGGYGHQGNFPISGNLDLTSSTSDIEFTTANNHQILLNGTAQIFFGNSGTDYRNYAIRDNTTAVVPGAGNSLVINASSGSVQRSTSTGAAKKIHRILKSSDPLILSVLDMDIVAFSSVLPNDDPNVVYVGGIAEDVAESAPVFAVFDDEGTPTGIQYSQIGVALVPLVKDLILRIEKLEELVDKK